jgi:hypothetical protein
LLYRIPSNKADKADTDKNPMYMLSLNKMVSGFPTAGGFPGYLMKGTTNKTKHMANDKKTALFMSLENGIALRQNIKTIPRSDPKAMPNTDPPTKLPDFCQILYEFCSSLVGMFSPISIAFAVSRPMALSTKGSTTSMFIPAKIKPAKAPEPTEIRIKVKDFIKIHSKEYKNFNLKIKKS